MSRLKQVFVDASEPGSVLSLCYCGSWNIREGGGSDKCMCQSVPTVLPSPFLAPSCQVAFGRTIRSLAFSSPLVSTVLVTYFVVSLLFLWTFRENVVSAGMIFEVQAGCAGVTVVQVVVRALLSFRAQAHQSYRLHEIFCLSEQVSLIFWLLQCSKHCWQSQECCNGICQDISTVKMNLFPFFMLMQRWKGCPQCLSQQLYKRQGKKKLPLLSKPCSLSARTDMSGQNTSLPVLFPFSLPAGAVLRVFFPASKFSIAFVPCSAGTLPLGAWRCGHPMRQLAHSYF